MTSAAEISHLALYENEAPRLLVFIDTEEEFSWDSFSASATGVANIAHQHKAQRILEQYGIVPSYLVDYPVATKPDGIAPLKELLQSGTCEIGAQLHSWVNPPVEEETNRYNSFQCNLPVALERAKIASLTAAITQNFGVPPKTFKAGRNGFGPNTPALLSEFGYKIDNSVLPYADLAPHGPDFTGLPTVPYWLDSGCQLLEVPMTVGVVGLLQNVNPTLVRRLLSKKSARFRIPGLLAHSGLLERIRLTPEGMSLEEAKRLTLSLFQRGHRLFVMCYHSSSLLPGSTPYVRNLQELAQFLSWLSDYFEFFFGALGGRPTDTEEVLRVARKG